MTRVYSRRDQRRKLVLWIGLGTAALLLMLALGHLGVWLFAGDGSEAPTVYRRDALRELGREEAPKPE